MRTTRNWVFLINKNQIGEKKSKPSSQNAKPSICISNSPDSHQRVYEIQKYTIISQNLELGIAYNFTPCKNVEHRESKTPLQLQRIRAIKKNITLKQRLQFYIINKESECYSVVAVRVRVLTGVTNRGLDSVATVEKKLDKP